LQKLAGVSEHHQGGILKRKSVVCSAPADLDTPGANQRGHQAEHDKRLRPAEGALILMALLNERNSDKNCIKPI